MIDSDFQHHLSLRRGDVGRYVLLPGDPGRCEPIASHFDNAAFVASNREYTTWTGMVDGERVSVVSTGIGCPSTAIAVEELLKIGSDTFIRVGTAGPVRAGIANDTLGIITAAIRDEGTSRQYVPIEFPAVASPEVVDALVTAAERRGVRNLLGVSQSKDSFYGELEPDRMPVGAELKRRWRAWIEGGAICSEMEASTLFLIAALNGARAGGVMQISDTAPADPTRHDLLGTAVDALRVLIARDREGVSWP